MGWNDTQHIRNEASFFCRFVVCRHSSKSKGRRRSLGAAGNFGRTDHAAAREIGCRGGISAADAAVAATDAVEVADVTAAATVVEDAVAAALHFLERGATEGRFFGAAGATGTAATDVEGCGGRRSRGAG